MAYYPQIYSNAMITQLPYETQSIFDTVTQDMETGMRWSFSRTANNLDGYPAAPLTQFGVNYSNITDNEVATIKAFFDSQRGMWGQFGFVDPGGNLLQYSEDFTQNYWNKSNGPVSIGSSSVTDPFGGALAMSLIGNGPNAYLTGVIGPPEGGFMDWVLNASVWVKSPDVGGELRVGFIDSTFSEYRAKNWSLPQNRWIRISHTAKIWTPGEIRIVIGGFAAWTSARTINMFGAQVTPMKGEGAYVKSPGRYGFRSHCRFGTDVLSVKMLGPNSNALNLPIQEVYA